MSEEWGETGRNRLVVIVVSATVGAAMRPSAGISATVRAAARWGAVISAAAGSAGRWPAGIGSSARSSAAIAAISASVRRSARIASVTSARRAAAGIAASAARSYDWLLHIQCGSARSITAVSVVATSRIVLAGARLFAGLINIRAILRSVRHSALRFVRSATVELRTRAGRGRGGRRKRVPIRP